MDFFRYAMMLKDIETAYVMILAGVLIMVVRPVLEYHLKRRERRDKREREDEIRSKVEERLQTELDAVRAEFEKALEYSSPQDNTIFMKFKKLLEYDVHTVIYNCEFRKILFTDLLVLYINAYKDICTQIAQEEVNGMGRDEFKEFMGMALARIWDAFRKAVEEANSEPLTMAYKAFCKETKDTSRRLESAVNRFCDIDRAYTPNEEKLNWIFELFRTELNTMFYDIGKVLYKLNGELKNKEYKGLKCDPEVCPMAHKCSILYKEENRKDGKK